MLDFPILSTVVRILSLSGAFVRFLVYSPFVTWKRSHFCTLAFKAITFA